MVNQQFLRTSGTLRREKGALRPFQTCCLLNTYMKGNSFSVSQYVRALYSNYPRKKGPWNNCPLRITHKRIKKNDYAEKKLYLLPQSFYSEHFNCAAFWQFLLSFAPGGEFSHHA